MVETRVRRRPVVWPWVVGLTVTAVVVWLLSERFVVPEMGREGGPAEQVKAPPVSAPASGPVHMA